MLNVARSLDLTLATLRSIETAARRQTTCTRAGDSLELISCHSHVILNSFVWRISYSLPRENASDIETALFLSDASVSTSTLKVI